LSLRFKVQFDTKYFGGGALFPANLLASSEKIKIKSRVKKPQTINKRRLTYKKTKYNSSNTKILQYKINQNNLKPGLVASYDIQGTTYKMGYIWAPPGKYD